MRTQPIPDPRILFAIDKLQQSLVSLSDGDSDEVRLRIKIEEAIETGYQVAYSRVGPAVAAPCSIIRFPKSQAS
jgi:hypothetical protein